MIASGEQYQCAGLELIDEHIADLLPMADLTSSQHGDLTNIDELLQQTIIGFDEDLDFIDTASEMGQWFMRNNFALRTDHLLAQINLALALARAGAGIVGTHVGLAKHWPELVRIMPWVELPKLEFWLVCHRDVQYNSRIRGLMQFLAEWFKNDPYRDVIL